MRITLKISSKKFKNYKVKIIYYNIIEEVEGMTADIRNIITLKKKDFLLNLQIKLDDLINTNGNKKYEQYELIIK